MKTNTQQIVAELNRQYHELLVGATTYKDCIRFKNLVKKTKKAGYGFRTNIVDLNIYDLDERESKVYSRIEFLTQEIRFGEENCIRMYTLYMGECREQLYHETFVSLYKRELIDRQHFSMAEDVDNLIDFRRRQHSMDEYIISDK